MFKHLTPRNIWIPLVVERAFYRQPLSLWYLRHMDQWPSLDVPVEFFFLFFLPKFQWPLKATSNCWILWNVLSELYKKPSAQRAPRKTKPAKFHYFYCFSLWKDVLHSAHRFLCNIYAVERGYKSPLPCCTVYCENRHGDVSVSVHNHLI